MAEVDAVSQQYMPLSQACSSIFSTLEALHQVHFLYQYSLQFFLDIYNDVLSNNSHLNNITDPNMRLNTITHDLFVTCYSRVSKGMLHDDWIIFALLLCKIHLKGFAAEPNFEFEFDYFLKGGRKNLVSNSSSNSLIQIDFLNSEQSENITSLSKLNGFKSIEQFIVSNKDKFEEWLESGTPEDNVPKLWDEERLLTEIGTTMQQLLVIQAFRPDRVISMLHKIVEKVFSSSFLHASNTEIDLTTIVEKEIKASSPILMCSVPGYDASGRVDDLAAELSKTLTSIALGSSEGFSQAEKVINSSAKTGKWVMLKNVHLAPQWLIQLKNKLHTLQPHSSFRLFLTLEIHPKVPVNLLRASRCFVYEPPPGIKANLLRTFNTIPASRMMKEPHERSKLYFILSWFHAIVQERLRYCPLGWSKKYEFNESDLRVACDTLDTWVDSVALGRTNLPPEKVPWSALCTLLGQCIYGGKIDNTFDHRLLISFLGKLFTPKSFESDFVLVDACNLENGKAITMPEGSRRDHFLHWVNQLPERQTPSWLGLPDSTEKVLLTNEGAVMVSKLLKLQLLEDDDEIVYVSSTELNKEAATKLTDGRPSWMRNIQSSAQSWNKLLPDNLSLLKRTVENIKDPLFRYFEREVSSASKLLNIVLQDLRDVILICKGEKKQTNRHRMMLSDLAKGVIPNDWKLYIVPQTTTVIRWITDFSERVKQLIEISNLYSATKETSALQRSNVWLGGLLNPEAYITASRQYVAQLNGWSLVGLWLTLEIDIQDSVENSKSKNDFCFGVTGLKLQGAIAKNNKLYSSSTMLTELSLTNFKWIRKNESKIGENKVTLPVYLNSNRSDLLFTVDLETDEKENKSHFYERGVAFISSPLT